MKTVVIVKVKVFGMLATYAYDWSPQVYQYHRALDYELGLNYHRTSIENR